MRYVTAGESHGRYLTAIVTDVPAGIPVSVDGITSDLRRRAVGYGRSARQQAEGNEVAITAGVADGKTTGGPVALMIANDVAPSVEGRQMNPRPGHADLVGALKYNLDDCQTVMERASARETAMRVAAAGIAREFLAELGVDIKSYTVSVGEVSLAEEDPMRDAADYDPLDIETSSMRCPDEAVTRAMERHVDEAREYGDTIGGTFRVVVTGLVAGLGGYALGADRLTGKLAAAVCSVPSVKGVEFGIGFEAAHRAGSCVHDVIVVGAEGFTRASNNAGGLEGGMTTGMPLIITAACKPVPTLADPLDTVNMLTLAVEPAATPRADVCIVPSAAVIAEAEVAFVLAQAYLDKFGRDSLHDIKQAVRQYRERLRISAR